MRSALGAGAAALLLLGGCSTQACTVMGCRGNVGVQLGRLGRSGGQPVTARLCAGERCTTQTFPPSDPAVVVRVELPTTNGDAPAPSADVTLRVTQGSAVLVDTEATASLSRFAPNGDGCDPVCWSAALILQQGHLVTSPAG